MQIQKHVSHGAQPIDEIFQELMAVLNSDKVPHASTIQVLI